MSDFMAHQVFRESHCVVEQRSTRIYSRDSGHFETTAHRGQKVTKVLGTRQQDKRWREDFDKPAEL
jgi:hypothetical protein